MPYLRFSRDKRGYENTYVLHTFRGKRGPEPRLLYWFRTPPGARVGRNPLDDEAIRAIEESNPGLDFDWAEMRKARPAPRPPEGRRGRPRAAKKKPPPAPPSGQPAKPEDPAPAAAPDEDVPAAAHVEDVDAPAAADMEDVEEVALPPTEPEDDDQGGRDGPWEHPVAALMGEEMLARLRTRFAEVQARIAAPGVEPAARDAALARTEALDPDGWDTLEDAVHGIEQFEPEADAVMAMLDAPPAPPADAPAADDDSA